MSQQAARPVIEPAVAEIDGAALALFAPAEPAEQVVARAVGAAAEPAERLVGSGGAELAVAVAGVAMEPAELAAAVELVVELAVALAPYAPAEPAVLTGSEAAAMTTEAGQPRAVPR